MGTQKQHKEKIYKGSLRVAKYHKMSLSSLTRCLSSIENCWEAASNKIIAKQTGNQYEMEEAEKKMQTAFMESSEASTVFIKAVENKVIGEQQSIVEYVDLSHQTIIIIAGFIA